MPTKKFMPKLLAAIVLFVAVGIAIAGCTASGNQKNSITIVYHLNGGQIPWASSLDENGNYTDNRTGRDVENGVNLMTPSKETWLFEGWFLEEGFQNKYEPPMNKIPASECDGRTKHLYAKWTDKIVITSGNFTDYFQFSRNWNGGLNDINARVNWSIAPKTTDGYSSGKKYVFNPQLSQAIEIKMHTNGSVWNLQLDADSYYESDGSVGGFVAGQTVGSALNSVYYTVLEGGYELYLLHKEPFSITLDLDGGTCQDETEFVFLGGDILEYSQLPVPTRDGYRLMGWASTEHSDGRSVVRNTTVTAQWKKEHILSYDLNGDILSPITLLDGDKLVLPKLTKVGFEFLGWYYDAGFTQPITYSGYSSDDDYIYPNIEIHNDLTIFARFETICEITFVTNGGTVKEPVYVANTKTPSLGADPKKSGLIFCGWFLDEELTTKYESQPISGDITLYAFWCYSYTISSSSVQNFIDVDYTMERMPIEENGLIKNKLVTTLFIELKDEYKQFECVIMFTVYANFKKTGSSTNYGDFAASGLAFSTLNGRTSPIEYTNYLDSNYSAYTDADYCDITINVSYGYIYFPEGYII